MRTIKRIIVSALILSMDNKLLMGKKDPDGGGVYSDCWHIPGGGVNAGEAKVEALIREIREELGLQIELHQIELLDDSGKGTTEKILNETGERVLCEMDFNVYKIVFAEKNADEIEITLSDDLVEYKWFDLPELKQVKLTPPSMELFKRLELI